MPAVYLLIGVVAVLLYLAYLAVAVPIGAALAVAACFLGMPGCYFVGLARRPKPPPGGDPAVPQYFYGQALADADHAVRTAYQDCRGLWRFCGATVAGAFTS